MEEQSWMICQRCSLRVKGEIFFLTILEGNEMNFMYSVFHGRTSKICWGIVDQMDLFSLLLQGALKDLNGVEDLASAMATPQILEGLGILEQILSHSGQNSNSKDEVESLDTKNDIRPTRRGMNITLLDAYEEVAQRPLKTNCTQHTMDAFDHTINSSEPSGFEEVSVHSPLSISESYPSVTEVEIDCRATSEESLKQLMYKDCSEIKTEIKNPIAFGGSECSNLSDSEGSGFDDYLDDNQSHQSQHSNQATRQAQSRKDTDNSNSTSGSTLRKIYSMPVENNRSRAPSDSVGSSFDDKSGSSWRRCHSWTPGHSETSTAKEEFKGGNLDQSTPPAVPISPKAKCWGEEEARMLVPQHSLPHSSSSRASSLLDQHFESGGPNSSRSFKVCNVEGHLLNVNVETCGDTEVRISIEPNLLAIIDGHDIERYSGSKPRKGVLLRDHTMEFLFKIVPNYLKENEPNYIQSLKKRELNVQATSPNNLKMETPMHRGRVLKDSLFTRGQKYEVFAWIGSRGTLEIDCTNYRTNLKVHGSISKDEFQCLFPEADLKIYNLLQLTSQNLRKVVDHVLESAKQRQPCLFDPPKESNKHGNPNGKKNFLKQDSFDSDNTVPKVRQISAIGLVCEAISTPFTACRKRINCSRVVGTTYYAGAGGNCSMTCFSANSLKEEKPSYLNTNQASSAPASFRESVSKRFSSPKATSHKKSGFGPEQNQINR